MQVEIHNWRREFVNKFNDRKTTADSLAAYMHGGNLHGRNYGGVSHGDCGKMIALRAIVGTLALGADPGTGQVRPLY